MFHFLSWLLRKRRRRNVHGSPQANFLNSTEGKSLHSELSVNLDFIRRLFDLTPDLVIRRLTIRASDEKAALVFIAGLTDKTTLNNDIIRPLTSEAPSGNGDVAFPNVSQVSISVHWDELESAILQGNTVLLIDGRPVATLLDTKGWPQRAIEDPQIETSLKGAHQGFTESGGQNISMIRRYIPNRELKIKEMTIGSRGKCMVWLMYLGDVANPRLVSDLETRLRSIEIDSIINTGELVEFIEDNPYSPFPQFILTERPDSTVSQILQGRIAIVVDRSPSVLIAPATFVSFFQSIDDYSTRWLIASFIRMLRFLAFVIALMLPALYIAFISFNYEVIPIQLLFSIAESRTRVPFPPLLEAMLMEITLEMMREAGIRLPAPVGQTVGIVGGIIIGQTAVQAGIVSNIMVIVVASTAIASFIIPNYDMGTAIRLLRFPMMIIAFMFGIIGIVAGMMILIVHLISLESLGTPYGSPLSPFRWTDMKDTFVRFPAWKMIKRPKSAEPVQSRRAVDNRKKGDKK
ncbi:spore germination protein [Cohnella cholangitidis]|uniref:Spore germination protein n=1 Tax=Cohnella cholangitidis TaxID=2598458 RepID=A0A7G5BUU7_9BACL|nr:spore germination protein [Cohnella cholangitidis]QMV40731.1 spore germination protein [Cohnella cholangitidis]